MSLHHSPAAHPRAVDSPAEELGLLRDATGAPHELSPVNSPMNQASRQSLNSLSQTYTVPSLDTSTKTKTKKEKLKDGRNIEIEAVGVDLSTLEGSPLHAQLNRVESAAPKTKKLPKQTKPKILVNPQPQQQFRQPPTQAQPTGIRYPPGYKTPSAPAARPSPKPSPPPVAGGPALVPAAPPSSVFPSPPGSNFASPIVSSITSPAASNPQPPLPSFSTLPQTTFSFTSSYTGQNESNIGDWGVPSTFTSTATPTPPPELKFPDISEERRKMFSRRKNMVNTAALTEYEADLTSKDRERQKAAIRQILKEKVRYSWADTWEEREYSLKEVLNPRDSREGIELDGKSTEGQNGPDGNGEAEGKKSLDSAASEDTKWVERSAWESELSDSEDEAITSPVSSPPRTAAGFTTSYIPNKAPTSPSERRSSFLRRLSSVSKQQPQPASVESSTILGTTASTSANIPANADPFHFENPDSVGEVLTHKTERRRLRRQKRFIEELRENPGLRTFTARRDRWTGARVVRRPVFSSQVKEKEESQAQPTNGERKQDGSKENGQKSHEHDDGNQAESESDPEDYDNIILETLIPIAPPLLPPSTPMRKNVTRRAQTAIYDKVILQSQTPFCPINLQTVVSSCVEGWKRDGEWPPRGTEPEAMLSRRVVGDSKVISGEKKTWRRSLQRVFGRGEGGFV